jgi:predicted peptidase
MAGSTASQALFWIVTLAVVGAVGAVVYMGKVKGDARRMTMAGEARTATPMGDYTRFFEKKSMKVKSGVVHLDLTYHWLAPQKPWPAGIRFPLVMVLHDAPGNAYAAQYLARRDMQFNYPAFIFVPVLPHGMTWYEPGSAPEGNDYDRQRPKGLPGAMQVLDDIVKNYPVDTSRIYVVGCSEGGVGAFGAVKEYGEKVAAAVALAGGWSPLHADYFTKTPMLVMHGQIDSVIPAQTSRAVSVEIKRRGGPIEYIQIPGMEHNCPSPVFYSERVWRWLFSKKKPVAAANP